jgi:hypothetical protein
LNQVDRLAIRAPDEHDPGIGVDREVRCGAQHNGRQAFPLESELDLSSCPRVGFQDDDFGRSRRHARRSRVQYKPSEGVADERPFVYHMLGT